MHLIVTRIVKAVKFCTTKTLQPILKLFHRLKENTDSSHLKPFQKHPSTSENIACRYMKVDRASFRALLISEMQIFVRHLLSQFGASARLIIGYRLWYWRGYSMWLHAQRGECTSQIIFELGFSREFLSWKGSPAQLCGSIVLVFAFFTKARSKGYISPKSFSFFCFQ